MVGPDPRSRLPTDPGPTAPGPGGATATRTTLVVTDDRPLVRAGLCAVLGAGDATVVGADRTDGLLGLVESRTPDVAVVGIDQHDADPFHAIAVARSVRPELHVLVVAESINVVDLREAVIAGVDSFVLSRASESELRAAVTATAAGERVVPPEVAVQLAASWRTEQPGPGGDAVTPRELEVLQLLAEGMTNAEIGTRLGVSARTVKTHVQNLLAKLDTPDRTGAVARGFRLGLIS
ncbi:MAG: LuxR C-terminal-related transcriptional regulator [Actinomycetes bacterium]